MCKWTGVTGKLYSRECLYQGEPGMMMMMMMMQDSKTACSASNKEQDSA